MVSRGWCWWVLKFCQCFLIQRRTFDGRSHELHLSHFKNIVKSEFRSFSPHLNSLKLWVLPNYFWIVCTGYLRIPLLLIAIWSWQIALWVLSEGGYNMYHCDICVLVWSQFDISQLFGNTCYCGWSLDSRTYAANQDFLKKSVTVLLVSLSDCIDCSTSIPVSHFSVRSVSVFSVVPVAATAYTDLITSITTDPCPTGRGEL